MNDDLEKLKTLISDGDAEIDPAWIEELKRKYPFFVLPEGLALQHGHQLSGEERDDIIARIALSLPGGGDVARRLADDDGESRFERFYPQNDTAKSPTTNQAIDKFLEKYGSDDPAETEILERLIFNPVADYSQQLAKQAGCGAEPDASPNNGGSQDERINRFILSVRAMEERGTAGIIHSANGSAAEKQGDSASTVKAAVKTDVAANSQAAVKAPEPVADSSMLSESLAKIYIKTHRYERAYEILTRLSLSFPEKNAYFADQLRFLRKLMLAESIRKNRIEREKGLE